MATERRRFPRTKPNPDWTVQAFAEFDGAPSARNNVAVRLLDVGGKGACMLTVGRLREGINLLVEIANPKTGARFRAKSILRWSTTVQKDRLEAHVAGLEFMEAVEIRGEEVKFMTSWARGRTAFVEEAARREHTRFVPATCTAQCMKKGFLGYSSQNIARKLVDLSEGGLQLDLMEKLEAGHKVKIKLEFKSPAATFEAEGEVRWAKRNTMILEPHYMTGVKFTVLTPKASEDIKGLAKLFTVMGGGKSVDDGPPVGLI